MIARATTADIDTVRTSIDDAVDVFRESVLPALHEQPGYEGSYVLLSAEGRALVLTFWATEADADAGLAGGSKFLRGAGGEVRNHLPGRRPGASPTTWCSPRHQPSRSGERRAMTKLFGIPVDELAVVLLALAVAAFGTVGLLALRNRMFFRMGVRNVRRRPGRSVLIVVGSMLGTAIIAAALATGDTMGRTVRSSAISALGQADEVVAAKGVATALAAGSEGTTGTRYFPESYAEKIAAATRGSGLVDGVAPVIVETIAVQDLTTRQNEPRATLFAGDPRPCVRSATSRAMERRFRSPN